MTDKKLTALKTTNSLQRLAEMELKMTRYSKQNTDLSQFIKVQKSSGLATYKKPSVEPIKSPQNKSVITIDSFKTKNTSKLCNMNYGEL